ncbi:hypothetical protein [Candidatus Magnetaquicoccus inordinatus]|uniref:hypothetical protein n=1 Tax=Candidatus Magnetaquicoccus inordinatus TaxID=2496818 RepID=UPI00102CDDF5|nr:hypothetical protein [Candidatus Magnetaquicoccus inordinatus]
MTTQDTTPTPLARFRKQKSLLEKVQGISKSGFAHITEQMGTLSVGFASATNRSFSVQERLSPNDSILGIRQLQEDYRRIDQETKTMLLGMNSLVDQQASILERLRTMTAWALDIEQESMLPSMSEQVKMQIGCELERQTLGTIVDSLMAQIRTLIREVSLSTQESATLLRNISRRLTTDLASSEHGFMTLKGRTTTLLQQMTDRVRSMSGSCTNLDTQTNQANRIMFEMMQNIQFDDITSQRMEHVITTMEQVEQRLSVAKLKSADKRWAAIAARICSEQLADLSSEMLNAVQALQQNLEQIKAVANERKNSIIIAHDNAMTFQDEIADLSYQLSSLLRLGVFDDNFSTDLLRNFSKTENALFQAKRAFEMLVLTATRLENLLTSMECKNSPRVAALVSIMSQLTSRIQSEGVIQTRQLLDATNQLQEVGLDYSEHSTPRIMRVITLLRRVPLRAQQMEADHGDVLTTFNDIISETQSIIVQIGLLMAGMDFQEPFKKGVEHVLARIDMLLPELINCDPATIITGDLFTLATEFDDLAGLYTMARERKMHNNVLGGESNNENDGDNFELF